MKKIFILIVMILTMACFHCMGNTPGYTISGSISGLPEKTVLQFVPMSHVNQSPIGEAVVNSGKFSFKGNAPEPRGLIMLVKNNYGALRFMVANGEEIHIDGKAFGSNQRDGKVMYNFKDVKVSGSATTNKFNELMSNRQELDNRFNELQKKYANIHKIFSKEGQSREVIDSVRNTPEYKKMQEEEHQMFADADKNYNKVVADNRDSFWGPLMMIAQLTYLTPQNRPQYEALSDNAKNSYYGRMVKEELYPLGAPGDAVPSFNSVLIDGKKTSLAELCKGKKYVLIDFWASWCKPCRKEIPNLKQIYGKHNANGFDIVSISIDENEAQWKKAVEKEGLTWSNIRDTDKTIASKYHVASVPTMYIINGEGKLVAENLRGEELASKIDELMK